MISVLASILILAATQTGDKWQSAVSSEPVKFRQVLELGEANASTGKRVIVQGMVTFVSGIETNRFVVAPMEDPKQEGFAVLAAAGVTIPSLGDLVEIEGATILQNRHPAVRADRVDVIRNEDLPPPKSGKQADFRRGLLNSRRISLKGTVRELRTETKDDLLVTRLLLYIDRYSAKVLLPGAVDAEQLLGEPVRVVGLASAVYGVNGDYLESELEVSGLDSIQMLRKDPFPATLLAIAAFFGAALLVVSAILLWLWLRGLREQRLMSVIDAERRRMAADLHDTIEQHLAGANLLAASVMAMDGVTPEITEVMKSMAAVLANAKSEVRSVVMNLRSAGQEEKTLADLLGDVARGLAKTGLEVRKWLRGLPTEMPAAACQDLILIVREAATNAVKHGKAQRIVLASDPIEGGFVLRVLNDGEPFDPDRALGPDAGHYGLSGMKERALRNRFQIGWGRLDRWTFVEIRVCSQL